MLMFIVMVDMLNIDDRYGYRYNDGDSDNHSDVDIHSYDWYVKYRWQIQECNHWYYCQ